MKKNTCLRAKNTWRSKIILHHRDSKEFRKLKARLKLLRVVRLGIHALRNTGQQLPSRCAELGTRAYTPSPAFSVRLRCPASAERMTY